MMRGADLGLLDLLGDLFGDDAAHLVVDLGQVPTSSARILRDATSTCVARFRRVDVEVDLQRLDGVHGQRQVISPSTSAQPIELQVDLDVDPAAGSAR